MCRLQYAAFCHPGRVRGKNEDNCYIDGKLRSEEIFSCSGTVDRDYLLASVCDGMGGEAMGETASRIAVEVLDELYSVQGNNGRQRFFSNQPMLYFDRANNRICQRMQQEHKRMGTTFAAVELADHQAVALNVGDSRVYRLHDGGLEQLSRDHSVIARLLRQGLITEQEAKTHPMRHTITQYLGIYPEEMLIEPFVSQPVELEAGDWYLVCSDGLTDMLTNEQIREILLQETETEGAVKKLAQEALNAGGKDNITVILIQVETDDRGYVLN